VTIDTLRGYQYKGGANAAAVGEITGVGVAGTGSAKQPNQCALVMSLRTALPGRSFRGRMYMPIIGGSMGTNGLLAAGRSDAWCAALANDFGTFNSSGFGKIVVCSPKQSAMTQVSAVEADSVVDTQRRRRDALADTAPSTHAVAA
jgi:hypothetical protein